MMYASGLRSEDALAQEGLALLPIRARGRISVEALSTSGSSHRGDVHESGALRVRFPREHLQRLDATIVNVAGGMTGGDSFDMAFEAGEGACLFVSSAAAEKIYRSSGAATEVNVRLAAKAGARCIWLPQETIVFNRARLNRTLEAQIDPTASVLACEMTIIGRAAMNEIVDDMGWRERWRIRRGGRLVLAEDTRIEGDAAGHLARPATGNGAHAFATLVYVAPDAEGFCDALRDALPHEEKGCEAGVSAFDGLTVARFAAKDGASLRAAVVACVAALPGLHLPRGWHT